MLWLCEPVQCGFPQTWEEGGDACGNTQRVSEQCLYMFCLESRPRGADYACSMLLEWRLDYIHQAEAGWNDHHSLEACFVKPIGSEPLGRLLPMSLVSEFVPQCINNKLQFPLRERACYGTSLHLSLHAGCVVFNTNQAGHM